MDIRRRMWLYLALLLLALGTMYCLNELVLKPQQLAQEENPTRDYQTVLKDGTIRLLAPYRLTLEPEHSPNNLKKLMEKLRKRSSLEVELRLEDNTHKALDQLLASKVDLVLHSIAHTSRLDSNAFVWLHEVVAEPIYLVQRQDSSQQLKKQLDLEHQTITLPLGSPMKIFVEHIADEMGVELHTEEDSLYNTEQLIMKVQAGSIDYTLCSGEEAKTYRNRFPTLDFNLPISHNLRRGWIARKATLQLADSLSVWLR